MKVFIQMQGDKCKKISCMPSFARAFHSNFLIPIQNAKKGISLVVPAFRFSEIQLRLVKWSFYESFYPNKGR